MNMDSTQPITWRRYGPSGLIFTFSDHAGEKVFERLHSVAETIENSPPPDLVDYFRGYTTLTLEFSEPSAAHLESLAVELANAWNARPPLESESRLIEIPVRYDGPDLPRVAQHAGLSVKEVCSIHLSANYRVHMIGFCPGFPYLHGLDPRLNTPRLDTPRTLVSAGSVAIGGEQTGIYPVNRPGGWNIIGHTLEKLFHPDLARGGNPEKAFLLRAGDLIRFVPAR